MKKKISFAGLLLCMTFLVQSQQLTRFATVDIEKVALMFYEDSRAYRDLQAQSARVQREIDLMNKDILKLKSEQQDAEIQGDKELSLRLSGDIRKKTEFLRDYQKVKTAELTDELNRLTQSDAFWKQIRDEVRYIAESEGYTMVLNTKDPNILWSSASVDITAKLITNLRSKSR